MSPPEEAKSDERSSGRLRAAVATWLSRHPATAELAPAEYEAVAALADTVLAPAVQTVAGARSDVAAFVVHLAACVEGAPLIDALSSLRAADLWLAWCCTQGDAAALRQFHTLFDNEFAAASRRLRCDADTRAEFVQGCREAMVAPPAPKLARYSGQGDLRHFLRVALVRKMIDFRRKLQARQGRERPLQAQDNEVPAPSDDVEMAYLKNEYGGAFRAAFARAVSELTAAQRNLLRHHYADGMNVDELGRRYGVHRATAARRVARARQELLERTRQQLMQALKLNPQELDSVLRLIESNVHVSVQRVLAS